VLKIEQLNHLGENMNATSIISFPEVPDGNKENEGDQILVPDQQSPSSQIFQGQPSG
jgi:hypothetical protein